MTAGGGASTVSARMHDVIDRAKGETGLDQFGGDTWCGGLEVLIRAAETEAEFNDFGGQSFYAWLVRAVVNRLMIEDWYRRRPESDEPEVRVELLGVGFHRTGSTALSHMLAADGLFRNLRNWEEQSPCPPPGLIPEADADRVASARAMVEMGRDHMAARLRSMLPQSAT